MRKMEKKRRDDDEYSESRLPRQAERGRARGGPVHIAILVSAIFVGADLVYTLLYCTLMQRRNAVARYCARAVADDDDGEISVSGVKFARM